MENDAGKEVGGGFQAFVDGGQGVFMLDADHVVIAAQAKRTDNLLPDNFA